VLIIIYSLSQPASITPGVHRRSIIRIFGHILGMNTVIQKILIRGYNNLIVRNCSYNGSMRTKAYFIMFNNL